MASSDSDHESLSAFLHHILSITRSEFNPDTRHDRIVVINMMTQATTVFSGGDDDDDGEPPASKAAIDGLKKVEVESAGSECVICLEEWGIGDVAKEMPCQHRFHGECVEKWLKIHGTCPVCRFKMDDDDEDGKVRGGNGNDGIRRELWVTFRVARAEM